MEPPARDHGGKTIVATFVYGTHVNVPELIVQGGTMYRVIHDHLGSPRLVVEQSTGTIVQRMGYDEWGQITLDTNPGFQPFGFAGGIYDVQNRLVRFGMRDYDASVGRFTTRDPVLFSGNESNLHVYVAGDPVNLTDVLGLCVHCYFNVAGHTLTCLGEGETFSTDAASSGAASCGGLNNPCKQNLESCGPIPSGIYKMGLVGDTHTPHDIPRVALRPTSATETFGRGGQFQIHPGRGTGCITMPLDIYNAFRQFYESNGQCGAMYVF